MAAYAVARAPGARRSGLVPAFHLTAVQVAGEALLVISRRVALHRLMRVMTCDAGNPLVARLAPAPALLQPVRLESNHFHPAIVYP
jgi:hypothetical protein